MKRIGWHGVHGMQEDAKGDYILHSDHEDVVGELTNAKCRWFLRAGEYLKRSHEAEAEVARLRAEVEGLREKCDELSMLHVSAVQDKSHLEIKYRNACARAASLRVDAERYRFLRSGGCDATLRFHNTNAAHRDDVIDAAMGEGK